MLVDILLFLIRTLAGLLVLLLLLRFYLQVARAPFKHPVCQFVMAATNFVVLPLRRLIPSIRGYDSATLLLAWLVSLLSYALQQLLLTTPELFTMPQVWINLMILAVLEVFRKSLILLMGAVIVQAILSWVSPYNPLSPVLEILTRPFLRPFRKVVLAGVDLSPIIVLLIIQVILMVLLRLEPNFLMQLKVTF